MAETTASTVQSADGSTSPKDTRGALRGGKAKGITLGLDIAPYALRIAVMERSGGRTMLRTLREAPYPPQAGPGSAGFAEFLRMQISAVAGSTNPDIWVLVPTAEADLWRVRIPKVPKKRESETFCWAIKRDKSINEAEQLLDFEVQGEVLDKGIPKLQAIAYTVPRKALKRSVDMLRDAGFEPAGATIPPLALQTAIRSTDLARGAGTCASVFIGRGWSRIDVFDGDNLVMSRGIKAGLGSMVEELQAAYSMPAVAPQPAEDDVPVIDLDMEATDDAPTSLDGVDFELEVHPEEPAPAAPTPAPATELTDDEAKALILARLLGESIDDNAPGAELSTDEVMALIRPALDRLVRQIERTFNHYVNAEGGDAVRRILLSGQVAASAPIRNFLCEQLSLDCGLFDPLASSTLASAETAPPRSEARRMEFNLPAALAFSDTATTPNLLRNYAQRDRDWQAARQARIIYATFLAAIALLGGVFGWQSMQESAVQTKLDAVNRQIAAYAPPVNEQLLLKMASQVQNKQRDLKALARKYEGLAVLREVGTLTPESIKIRQLDLTLGAEAAPKKDKRARRARNTEPPRLLVLEGTIPDAEESRDSILASYIVTLQSSPLFSDPVVHSRELVGRGANTGLHFILHVNVER